MASVSYSDKRQHPRQKKLYMTVLVIICLHLLGLAVFFLYPRSVDIHYAGVRAVAVTYDESNRSVYLNITNTVNITNNNFYPIEVESNITGHVHYLSTLIGESNLNNVTKIRPLGTTHIDYTVPTKIGRQYSYMYTYCTLSSIKVQKLAVKMQVMVAISYMWHQEQLSQEYYQLIDCGANTTYHLGQTNVFK